MNGGSINRCSRPGSLTAHTSISGGKSAAQVRKIPAPPPAYGKQNRRKRACGFGAAEVTQVSEDVVVVMRFAPIAICHAICPFPPVSSPILFGTQLVYGACAPSPLAGAGWDGGETCAIEAMPAFTPTPSLPLDGGGDPVEPSAQDWYRTVLHPPHKEDRYSGRRRAPRTTGYLPLATAASNQAKADPIVLSSAVRLYRF
jgi:hypothetical protein